MGVADAFIDARQETSESVLLVGNGVTGFRQTPPSFDGRLADLVDFGAYRSRCIGQPVRAALRLADRGAEVLADLVSQPVDALAECCRPIHDRADRCVLRARLRGEGVELGTGAGQQSDKPVRALVAA